jgi:branched-chain amino acid transport system permease protein
MSVLVRAARGPAVPLSIAVVLLCAPSLGLNQYWQLQLILVAILTLLAAGLNLSLGFAGELSLAQVAMYAAGAYVSGYLASHGYTDIFLNLLAATAAALLVGLVTGIPGLRLGGWSLAMTSFFVVLLVPDVIDIFSGQTGGELGLGGIGAPTLFGSSLSGTDFYYMTVVVGLLWLFFMRNLLITRHGVALLVLRRSPVLATSLGMSVFATKLKAYMLGAIPAGLAGCLFAFAEQYLSSASFDFSMAITILAASIIGGTGSIYGAAVGAAVVQLGVIRTSSFGEYATIVYGVFLVLGGIFLGGGLAGLSRRLAARWGLNAPVASPEAGGDAIVADDRPPLLLSGATLEITNVYKSFRGNHALQNVSFAASPGEVTALVGPNGSGKTTVLNVVSHFYVPDSGTVVIGGALYPRRWSPARIARVGVSRTFQTPLVPPGISVREAVTAALYARHYVGIVSTVLRLPAFRRRRREDWRRSAEALAFVGLSAFADKEAAILPLGTRRLFELARALVAEPRVLLLDEIASGLDEAELGRIAEIIRRIRDAGGTVVMVEHNFGLVLELSDSIVVLAEGSVIAAGPPGEIRDNPRVRTEYLGLVDDEASATSAEPDDRTPSGVPGEH